MTQPAFDLVVRNGRLATASDTFAADIGIVGGRIVEIGGEPGSSVDVRLDVSGTPLLARIKANLR